MIILDSTFTASEKLKLCSIQKALVFQTSFPHFGDKLVICYSKTNYETLLGVLKEDLRTEVPCSWMLSDNFIYKYKGQMESSQINNKESNMSW